jgi:hypothetical protein
VKRIGLIVILVCTIALAGARPAAQTLAQGGLQLITQLYVRDGSDTKFPHVDAAGGRVAVSANSNENNAFFWIKQDNATTFPAPVRFGDARGDADYSNVAVDLRPDGTAYVAWVDQPSKQIFMRKRAANGDLGPTRVVDAGSPFPVGVEIVVASDGAIFVIWRNPDSAARYRRSTDDGASWSNRGNVSDGDVSEPAMGLAAGPNGQVVATYTAGVNDLLQVFVSTFNGSAFQPQQVSSPGAEYANSSVSFSPDGRLWVSWRGVSDSNTAANAGVWFSERQSNGTFTTPARLVSGKILSTAMVSSDEGNNLHFSWLAEGGGVPRVYYAFRPNGGTFAGPIEAPVDGANMADIRAAANLSSGVPYNHVVTEAFVGDNLYTRYHLFAAPASLSAVPTIEGGAERVGNRSFVSVNFVVQGSPNQIRWRWGAPPTDTTNDSNGWVGFAPPVNVPVPDAIRTSTSCTPVVLYTQVRNTNANLVEQTAQQDSIIIDSNVTLDYLNVLNPYSSEAANDPPTLNATAANDGDPRYTRIPAVNIELAGSSDCAGLESIAVGKDTNTLEPATAISNNAFDTLVTLPGSSSLTQGRNDFVVRIKDKAGNTRDVPSAIFYDDGAPVLNTTNPGTITLTVDPRATVLADLQFSNISVTDLVYPGRGFWGVWLANSLSPVADPLNNPNLVWVALPAAGSTNSFTINNWSLLTGLTSAPAGTYYVYARFLDGAGNATTGYLTVTVNLTNPTRPETFVPLLRK